MAAIQLGPNLADPIKNATLDLVAPDPGGIVAAGIMTPAFASAKRLRCDLVKSFGGTDDEIEAAAVLLHEVEHREMGDMAVGSFISPRRDCLI